MDKYLPVTLRDLVLVHWVDGNDSESARLFGVGENDGLRNINCFASGWILWQSETEIILAHAIADLDNADNGHKALEGVTIRKRKIVSINEIGKLLPES